MESIKDILNFLSKKNIKEIFLGFVTSSVDEKYIILLKKKIPISGLQHGGKYFIMQDDICHKDFQTILIAINITHAD